LENKVIWITSDQHFGHEAIIKYCQRPFKNAREMDDCIVDQFNSKVGKKDVVYHLGDFSFHKPIQFLKCLNGEHHLIRGNHDAKQGLECFKSVQDVLLLKGIARDFGIFLSHYSHRVWPHSHYGFGHCFGHSHGRLEEYARSFDIGVDTNNFYPYNIEEIVNKMINMKPIVLHGPDPLEKFKEST